MLKTIDNSEESSVLSYAEGMLDRLIKRHNTICAGMTAQEAEKWRVGRWGRKLRACHRERNRAIRVALRDHAGRGKWTVDLSADAVATDFVGTVKAGVIYYPLTMNMDNEGSIQSFLIQAEHKLVNRGKLPTHPNMAVVIAALRVAMQKRIDTPPFNLDLDDIVE